jgi:hypothetical protein
MGQGAEVRKTSVARRLRVALLALAAPAVLALVAQAAIAQTTKPAPRSHAAAARGGSKKGAPDAGTASTSAAGTLTAAPAAGPLVTVSNDGGSSGVVESKTLDGGTHVFKFSELDIEGRLKSPQLVYFLRRVRAEFSAGELGHRTFMREMSETRKESTF